MFMVSVFSLLLPRHDSARPNENELYWPGMYTRGIFLSDRSSTE